ncbi:MAG: EamA family transporter [Nostocaceae cyanobacterium]|nr:EamA family transporter [Nostocaceae cyanobacterium]
MRSLIVILLIVVLNVFGDIFLSHGIHQVGEIHPLHPVSTLLIGLQMFVNPWVVLAIILLMTGTLIYMSALSWLDLSYIMPMTKLQHLLTGVLAWLLLSEQISATRWMGILTITLGALLVSYSEQKNSKPGLKLSEQRPSAKE